MKSKLCIKCNKPSLILKTLGQCSKCYIKSIGIKIIPPPILDGSSIEKAIEIRCQKCHKYACTLFNAHVASCGCGNKWDYKFVINLYYKYISYDRKDKYRIGHRVLEDGRERWGEGLYIPM